MIKHTGGCHCVSVNARCLDPGTVATTEVVTEEV
jgi:hypothetical protein